MIDETPIETIIHNNRIDMIKFHLTVLAVVVYVFALFYINFEILPAQWALPDNHWWTVPTLFTEMCGFLYGVVFLCKNAP